MMTDRLDFILKKLEEWSSKDPNLEDKRGFLEFLKEYDLGLFNVGDTKIWLKYYREAKKMRVTVAELLFDKAQGIKKYDIKDKKKPLRKVMVDLVSEEKMRELKDMSLRLKSTEKERMENRS